MSKTNSKTARPAAEKPAAPAGNNEGLLFRKENYLLMVAGIVIIALGMFLMYGKEDIFSGTKITVAPITILLGFVIEIVAIMYRPKKQA